MDQEKVKVGDLVILGGVEHIFAETSARVYNDLLELGEDAESDAMIYLFRNLGPGAGGEFFSFAQVRKALNRGMVAEPFQSLGTSVGFAQDLD